MVPGDTGCIESFRRGKPRLRWPAPCLPARPDRPIWVQALCPPQPADRPMRLHLIESDQRALQTAECAFASLVLHTSLIWLIVGVLISGPGLPAAVRDTAALFLVPPDRKESPPAGQTARFQIGQAGGYFTDGSELAGAGSGTRVGGRPYGRQRPGERSSALGLAPL